MIDLSNDEGVRAALREIADWSAVDTAPPVDVLTDAARTHTRVVSLDDRRSRSTARLLGVAAAVVALVAGGLVVLSRRDADPAVGALAGGRWQSMATAPIEPRLAPSSVWTGTELLVWGGVTSSGDSLSDGAAYDPGTDTWRMIAPRPVDAAGSEPKFAAPAPAVFADGRVVTVVHRGEPGIWDWDLLVYDPSGDAWAVADSNRYDQLPTDELVPTEARRRSTTCVAWRCGSTTSSPSAGGRTSARSAGRCSTSTPPPGASSTRSTPTSTPICWRHRRSSKATH